MKESKQAAPGAQASSLARYRVRRGFSSAAAAAKEAGIPEATYRRYEDDMSRMPVSSLLRVCSALEVSADELLGLPVTGRKSEIEECYRAMAQEDRELLLDVARTLADRERQRAEARRAADDSLRCEGMARYYERKLYDAMAERDPAQVDLLVAGSPVQRSKQFGEFVVAEIAAAHDRRIGQSWAMDAAREQLGKGAGEAEVLEKAQELYWDAEGDAVREQARSVTRAWCGMHREEFLANYPKEEADAALAEPARIDYHYAVAAF